MFAVQILSPGTARFVETPKPGTKKGYALVRPRVVSLCGSDMFNLYYAPADQYPMPVGSTGHEVVATVESVEGTGTEIKEGMTALVLNPSSTGMAEFFITPLDYVIPIPESLISNEEFVQAQQLGTVLYAAKFLSTNVLGRTAVIVGQGSAGLYWAWILRRLGARRVIVIDQLAHRLVLPRRYGATDLIDSSRFDPVERVRLLSDGTMADIVVEAAGEEDAVRLAFKLVRNHGEVICFGIPHFQDIAIDYYRFFRKYLNVKCVAGSTDDPGQEVTRQAVELIADGTIDVKPLITHRFSFERVMEAYELHHNRGDGAIKIVVNMPE